jgi:3-oxoacyl-[acyl-carrier-protein] synthase III
MTINNIADDIFHQSNILIVSALADRKTIPDKKIFISLWHLGNAPAAPIPIAIDEKLQIGNIQPGDLT